MKQTVTEAILNVARKHQRERLLTRTGRTEDIQQANLRGRVEGLAIALALINKTSAKEEMKRINGED